MVEYTPSISIWIVFKVVMVAERNLLHIHLVLVEGGVLQFHLHIHLNCVQEGSSGSGRSTLYPYQSELCAMDLPMFKGGSGG